MTSKARVEFDPRMIGVRVALIHDLGAGTYDVLQWERPAVKRYSGEGAATEPSETDWLTLSDDDARALYEALADHFGHSGHDTRSLRKDYDAERKRVDDLIRHLIKATP